MSVADKEQMQCNSDLLVCKPQTELYVNQTVLLWKFTTALRGKINLIRIEKKA